MGTYSFFEYSAGDCEVDWDSMDAGVLLKFWRFEKAYDKRLQLCSEVGATLYEAKLFGYMDADLINALHEFNKHLVPNGQRPLWIFGYEGHNTRALRFYPGEHKIEILGGHFF